MSNYAERHKAPPTLTAAEQAKLLRTVGEHRRGFRDHVILALALGTGLREHELAALDVGDISADGRRPRTRILLRTFKGCRRAGVSEIQTVQLAPQLRHRVEVYLGQRRGELTDPLFPSRQNARISTRMLRELFARWQLAAGFERRHRFHNLRHTCASNLYRTDKNLRKVQEVLRHGSLDTTAVYTHPTEDEIMASLAQLPL